MTSARRVLNAIDDALIIRQRHPALFARMANANCSCIELGTAYDLYLNGISTRWWFAGDSISPRERARRRAIGKRQRQARKANRS